MLVGGSGVVISFTVWDVISDGAPGNTATSSMSFGSNGSAIGTASIDNGDGVAGSTAWYQPLITGIGAGFWLKYTPTTGTFTSNGAATFTALSSNLGCTKSGTSSSASVIFKVEIATDSGGTNIVFTSTGNRLLFQHSL